MDLTPEIFEDIRAKVGRCRHREKPVQNLFIPEPGLPDASPDPCRWLCSLLSLMSKNPSILGTWHMSSCCFCLLILFKEKKNFFFRKNFPGLQEIIVIHHSIKFTSTVDEAELHIVKMITIIGLLNIHYNTDTINEKGKKKILLVIRHTPSTVATELLYIIW